jgi:hypothetical protein
MKTTLTVLIVLFLVALIYYRERVYVRDPLATVYRNDVKQSDVRVYINYSNDVLLEQEASPTPSRILIQDWNKIPGTPMTLTCLRWTACLTDSDHTSTIPLAPTQPATPSRRNANPPRHSPSTYDPNVFMSSRQVLFTTPDGASNRIDLR